MKTGQLYINSDSCQTELQEFHIANKYTQPETNMFQRDWSGKKIVLNYNFLKKQKNATSVMFAIQTKFLSS